MPNNSKIWQKIYICRGGYITISITTTPSHPLTVIITCCISKSRATLTSARSSAVQSYPLRAIYSPSGNLSTRLRHCLRDVFADMWLIHSSSASILKSSAERCSSPLRPYIMKTYRRFYISKAGTSMMK